MQAIVARCLFVVVAVVVGPLVAWHLAVELANRGFGGPVFFATLLGVPVLATVPAAILLRRRRAEAMLGAIGAAVATFALVVALVFVALSSR